MARQKELEGFEREKDKEINDAAEIYVKARNARMKGTEKEVAAKQALIEVLKRKKVKSYLDAEADPPLAITLVPGKDGVKVHEVDEGGDDDEGEEQEAA